MPLMVGPVASKPRKEYANPMLGHTTNSKSLSSPLPMGAVFSDSSAKELLSDATAVQIAQRIESGEFLPGARLPPEREFAKELGVSRIVIREAFITLQAMGQVEAHVGRGRFVSSDGMNGRSNFFVHRWLQVHQSELEDLSVVRQILETAAVRDIPRNLLTDVGINLRSILDDARAAVRQNQHSEAARLDALFHMTTVEQASNRPLRNLAAGVIEMVHPSAEAVMSIPEASAASLDEHERIVMAFENGDVELATILIGHHQTSGHRRALLSALPQ